MPYKKTPKKTFRKNVKKSIIVGIIVLLIDLLGHTLFTARAESFFYYALKIVISGYVAYVYYSYKSSDFLLKLYASAIFSILHGIYYRILDFFQGNPFWSRVQDVVIGNVVFSKNNFGSSIMAWGLIYGGAFLISIFVADFLERKKWLK